jgi:hypothetical protein
VLQGAGDAGGERGAVDGGAVVGAPRVRVPQLPREYLHRRKGTPDRSQDANFCPLLMAGDLSLVVSSEFLKTGF